MKVCQQIVDLLIRQHISEAVHLVAAIADDISGAIVIRGHTAAGKILALEYAFQTRPLALA